MTLTLKDLVAFLTTKEIARFKLPERLELMEDLPKTPSGKLQKFKLRDTAKAFGHRHFFAEEARSSRSQYICELC